jgi:transcriptional regulator with XRE-family HTH domain
MLRVREICKEKRVSMADIAKRMGITYQALYASVEGNPSLSTLERIADALGVEVVELLRAKKVDFEANRSNFTALIDHGGSLHRFDSLGALKCFIHNL